MQPEVSVVIPTYRREPRLAFALDALASQDLEPQRFEVVVVRAPGEGGQLSESRHGVPVRFLESTSGGAGAQRNFGWRDARAPVVAFTDDDCRPSPGWLRAMLEATSDPGVVVQGRTEPDPDEVHLLLGLSRSIEVTGLDPWYPSCNIAYSRQLLEQLGGFDEDFEAPWGEDTDLALRALRAGARIVFCDAALAWHAVHPRALPAAFEDARRRSWIALVVALHPEQRQALWRGLFVNRSHAALAFWLAAALSARRRPELAAAAAIPYFGLHLSVGLSGPLHPKGLARLALHLPERLSLDLAELVSTVAGSVRHRSLVI